MSILKLEGENACITSLSIEQVKEFKISLAESYSDKNLMDISEAKQMHARWIKIKAKSK